jgi:pimeloyl-ACP methyl ester carboxylesterase
MLAFQPPGLAELVAHRAPERVERFLRGGGMTHEEVARFRTEILEYGALPGALAWYRALPFSVFSSSARTGRVRVPTTHVWSDRDVALARRGAELTADFVRAPYELVVLPDVDHWVPTHAPPALADAILARAGDS